MVEVTQGDRDAAAVYLRDHGPTGLANPGWLATLLNGDRDRLPLVQAFARHRQSAEQRLIDIAQACLDQGYPLAVALEMMRNDPRKG